MLDTKNSRVQKFDSKGNFLSKWGSAGSGDGQFNNPSGITFDSKNDLVYITDDNNKRIQVLDKNGNFVAKWGSETVFSRPNGIAHDDLNGVMYINDKVNNNVLVVEYGP